MTDQQNSETAQSEGDGDTNTDADRQEATGEERPDVDDETMELVAAEQVNKAMRQLLADQLGSNIDAEGIPDYYDVFDWDPNPTATDFYAMALRNPYAFAVTFLPAMTAWRDPPRIIDDAESADGQTQFESDLETLVREQRVWHYATRADMLAGIGRFGVLVLQFDDIDQDAVGDGGKTDGFASEVENPSSLQGLRPYSEASVEDIVLGGPGSDRWGKPVKYKLDLGDENDEEFGTEQAGPDEMWVHHSRVIHIHSDQLLDDEIRGIPRQQPVYNNLVDIEKTLGSAGELAYRATAWGININIDKDFDIEGSEDELREHLARWQAGLENVLRTHGADEVKSLGGENIDPQPVIDPNVEAISAQTGIPQSVLKGNETGERATTQDLKDWYGDVQERREQFNTPTIVREFIDRLIKYDILPEPQTSAAAYSVEWPPLHEMSAKDEAEIQKTRAETLTEWTAGHPDDYLTREQQRAFLEDGSLPSELDEIEERTVDEDDPAVQQQMDALEESMPTQTGQQPAEGDD
jgi:hypothetical protein